MKTNNPAILQVLEYVNKHNLHYMQWSDTPDGMSTKQNVGFISDFLTFLTFPHRRWSQLVTVQCLLLVQEAICVTALVFH